MDRSSVMNYIIILRTFLVILLLFTFPLKADGKEKKRGFNGPINRAELMAEFKAGKSVEGYVIQGNDIIDIIRQTDVDLTISDSIIEGGLNFTKLPAQSVDAKIFPAEWTDQQKTEWKNRIAQKNVRKVHVVTNKIRISNSEIKLSIKAKSVFFQDELILEESLIHQNGDFEQAIFAKWVYFLNANFGDKTESCEPRIVETKGFVRRIPVSQVNFKMQLLAEVVSVTPNFTW